jgi:hypothetical protein
MKDKGITAERVLVPSSVLAGIGLSLFLLVASSEVLAVISRVLVGGGLLGLVVVVGAALGRAAAGGRGHGGDEDDPPGDGEGPNFPLADLDAELFALLDEAADRRPLGRHPERSNP